MKIYLLILTFLLAACNNNNSISDPKKNEEDTLSDTNTNVPPVLKEQVYNLDSVKQKILKDNLKFNNSDNIVYEFSLEGELSAEGNAGKAFYKNGKVNKIDVTFYRETGKSTYSYSFGNEVINITKNIYDYDMPLSGNIASTKNENYQINFAGDLIKSDTEEIDLDTYFLLKKSIPFTLK
jgi:hypothetical protein